MGRLKAMEKWKKKESPGTTEPVTTKWGNVKIGNSSKEG